MGRAAAAGGQARKPGGLAKKEKEGNQGLRTGNFVPGLSKVQVDADSFVACGVESAKRHATWSATVDVLNPPTTS